jgi:hypothetical protein
VVSAHFDAAKKAKRVKLSYCHNEKGLLVLLLLRMTDILSLSLSFAIEKALL